MNISLIHRRYFVIIVVCTLLACSRFPDYSIDELLSTPEQIEINDREYILETSLWRDFFPGPQAPPDGSPLIAVIYVVVTDSLPFPMSLDADFLWVIKDGVDVWVTELEDDEMPTENYKLKKNAEGGPKWGPDIYVEAVVRIVDEGGNTHLLRAAAQPIGATY